MSTPPVPLTLEGASVLHQMMRFRRSAWRALGAEQQAEILSEAIALLAAIEQNELGQSALFSLFGYKGDVLLLHFRHSFEELHRAELEVAQLGLAEFFEPVNSYLSVVELGLYESSARTYALLAEKGIAPYTPEWNAEVDEVLAMQRKAMHPRLYPEMPSRRYLCFYPMNRRRGEHNNWYQAPLEERRRMMRDHGLIGRRYGGDVEQIISGSIGLDDWEWAVDLFSNDPVAFKKLIYEMRFDEASALYADFGPFYVGLRCPAVQLGKLLAGELPDVQP